MLGICFKRENTSYEQDQWSYAFSNYGITDIWERGKDGNKDLKIYQSTTPIDKADELPENIPLIVLAHQEGKYIRGVDSLVDFEHPEDAIYLFGGSHVNLSYEEDFGKRKPEHILYIPTVQHEMYSFVAGYIVLYDRFVKRGRHG